MTPNSHGGNRMSLKKALWTGVLIAAIGVTATLGALAGGGAVYMAVRDRLNAPPQSSSAAPAPAPEQTLRVDVNTAVEAAAAQVSPAVVTVVNYLSEFGEGTQASRSR